MTGEQALRYTKRTAWGFATDAVRPTHRIQLVLSGDRAGQYSIRINEQWRICFEWPDGAPGPSNVEIVDYH